MRFISSHLHGVLDYFMLIILLASPWIFEFSDVQEAMIVPMATGVLILLMSLTTKYEFGVINLISLRIHLMIDILAGIILTMSPWLLGFRDWVFWPHFILGILLIFGGFFTHYGLRKTSFRT
ncbi:SPW repeat protein [Belliella sp. DSM 111904]|uniref:SPW repeat protein n=1 Tax=Belliella filtrata TaxID=2923435 RepID=A0ABS9V2D8_9BACT|nr:SPW repeat protein [Belliella filtrata]MCH7410582.1 SPW repeat protein [Belliella filtrata]